MLDSRVTVGFCGVVLSIVTHEALHVVMHWGDIQKITLFPNRYAIVEIIIEPSAAYDLAIEESFAYTVTVATLLITAMLVNDMNEAGDERSVHDTIFSNDPKRQYSGAHKQKNADRLARLLGIQTTGKTARKVRKRR